MYSEDAYRAKETAVLDTVSADPSSLLPQQLALQVSDLVSTSLSVLLKLYISERHSVGRRLLPQCVSLRHGS